MTAPTSAELGQMHCVACEGGIPPLTAEQTREYLQSVPEWSLQEDGKTISRKWKLKSFVEGLQRIQAIGEIAENQQHHPDLHLTGYRNLRVELTTHAIGGLSQNDFILAAKIDALDS